MLAHTYVDPCYYKSMLSADDFRTPHPYLAQKLHCNESSKAENVVLDKFIMFAKDKAALDALISIKVQDDSAGDISKVVREDLFNLRTFAMEYDVGIRKGKLPGCFAREFGIEVAPFVMLRDPCQNKFEVVVEKKNGKVYFTLGWASLKGFYDILGGSWISIFYANRNVFLIRGMTRKNVEIDYPIHNPPKRFLLKHMTPSSSMSTNIPNAPFVYNLPKRFYHVVVKELSEDDVTSGNLCALHTKEAEITIVDYLGYSWKCWFKFSEDEDVSCIISGQWKHICETRKFVEGTAVKFGVTTERDNFIMYIAPPIMMVLRTKVSLSTIAAVGGPVYQLEQFFWKN